ncbi:hypothetical protein AAVH_04680 [Aphelenchoides avenae]|nr:hypothetical protein AAVH_04680 [Aphelenchus avenae]
MRPFLFILGLAFVTTVLIVNVDAIKCYLAEGNNAHQKVNCNGGVQYPEGAYGNGKCYKYDGSKYPKEWGCAANVRESGVEADVCDVQGFHCCGDKDYCNGDNDGGPDPPNRGPDPPNRGPDPPNRGPDPPNRGPDPPNGKPTGAVTSTTPGPLLIAITTGVIAAVGV